MQGVNSWPGMADKQGANFRLSPELLRRIKQQAMEEGLSANTGRAYQPSAVVERILRAHYGMNSEAEGTEEESG